MTSSKNKTFILTPFYQNLFRKNFELLKVKYQKFANEFIDSSVVKELIPSFNESMLRTLFRIGKTAEVQDQRFCRRKAIINTFLFILTNYEIQIRNSHHFFALEEWKTFAETVGLSTEQVIQISECLFQNNFKNFKWSPEEDLLLRNTIMELNPEQNERNKWVNVSKLFNTRSSGVQFRKPAQCKERWDNILKKNFKKGEWSSHEDLQILRFVLNNGTKWAHLSRLMGNRNEHCVKNRFFGILAKYCLIPIKKIKKDVNYLEPGFILDAINYYETLYGQYDERNQKIQTNEKNEDEEFKWNEFFKEFEDFFDD